MGQRHRRVRCPVAVVAAVEGAQRAVDRQLEAGDTPGPVVDLHPPGGMDGAVAEDPGVGFQQVEVLAQDLRQVGRALLLLPLQEQLEVYRGHDSRGPQGVQGREDRHDGRLVVARRAGEDPPLRIERPLDVREVHLLHPLAQRAGAHHRFEGIGEPPLLTHGLAVVVGVEHHRPLRPGDAQVAEEGRGRAGGRRETAHLEAPAAEHLRQTVGVLLDVGDAGGDVGQGEQVRQLAHDLLLVRGTVRPHLVAGSGRGLRGPGGAGKKDCPREDGRRRSPSGHRLVGNEDGRGERI